MSEFNQFNQPVGNIITNWHQPPRPQKITLEGNFCRLEPVSQRHTQDLFSSWHSIDDERDWAYFPVNRPKNPKHCELYIASLSVSNDPLYFAVISLQTGKAVGSVALQNFDTVNGVLEIGWVNWSPFMKRTASATEAIFLLLKYTFDTLHYRRCGWRTDKLNQPAIDASERLGFKYEGTYRQAQIINGRNCDLRWYSIINTEWTDLSRALSAWLRVENFDERGRQIQRLKDLMLVQKR